MMFEKILKEPVSYVAFAAAMIVALPVQVSAQNADESLTRGAHLGYPSITTNQQISSLETNPAGLGFIQGGQLHGLFDIAENSDDSQYGAFLGGGSGYVGAGFGIQFLKRPFLNIPRAPYRKYSMGMGFSSDSNFSFGASYHFFGSSNQRALDNLSAWDVGFQWRPASFLGFAGTAKNLNQPFLSNTRSIPIRLQAGVSLRLFDGRTLLELETDKTTGRPSLDWIPRAQFEPVEGISVFASARLRNPTGSALNNTSLQSLNGGLSFQFNTSSAKTAAQFTGENPTYQRQVTEVSFHSETSEPTVFSPGKKWIRVPVTSSITERPQLSIFGSKSTLFVELLDALESLRENENIEGITLELEGPNLGYGQIWELRQTIERLKESGIEVSIFTSSTSYSDIYLASVGQTIWVPPSEPYAPEGLHNRIVSYRELLSNIGVEAEFVRIGDYKSAPESFTKTEPTPENIDQTETYVDFLYSSVNRAIANSRDISTAELEETIDNIPLYPKEATDKGLVDDYIYRTELEDHVQGRLSSNIRFEKLKPGKRSSRKTWGTQTEIAIVPITGMIVMGKSSQVPVLGSEVTGHQTVQKTLKRLTEDPSVAGIVIRIDSPGGSAKASDLIYRAIREASTKKPVVTSMGNVAASGGYYTAAATDTIFATPNTITGSIGIFAGKFSLASLSDKIGINQTEIQRGERADVFDPYEPWTENEKKSLYKSMRYLYHLFLTQIAKTRPLTVDEIDEVGRGHIWSGAQAHKKQLVDKIGGLMSAVEFVEKKAGLKVGSSHYKVYPEPGQMMPVTESASSAIKSVFGIPKRRNFDRLLKAMKSALRDVGPGLRLPLLYDNAEPLALMPAMVNHHTKN